MPTWGRPGAVSSILTAIVGLFGTGPMPVNGFFRAGLGGAGLVAVGVGDGVGVAGGLGVVVGVALSCPPPPHAALASSALAVIAAAR
jgi:hypothetical protein